MTKTDKRVNFLDLIPGINCQWETNGEGRVSLLVPRFKNRFMKRIASKLGKSEFVKVRLDEEGSKVWNLIDGSSTVEQMGELLDRGNKTSDQLYAGLTEFLSILSRNRFIRFQNYS